MAFICGGARAVRAGLPRSADHYRGRAYVATGEPLDEEMQARIARHQQDRGPEWQTQEEPLALARCYGNRLTLRGYIGGLFDHVVTPISWARGRVTWPRRGSDSVESCEP